MGSGEGHFDGDLAGVLSSPALYRGGDGVESVGEHLVEKDPGKNQFRKIRAAEERRGNREEFYCPPPMKSSGEGELRL